MPSLRSIVLVLALAAWIGCFGIAERNEAEPALRADESHDEFDVVIAGGSTAALAAAMAAADEGARVALLEPTDWPGGQLTAGGVPAVDEAWHRIVDPRSKAVLLDVAEIARDPRNMTPLFRDMLLRTGNPGRGWVSRFCFEPKKFLTDEIEPQLAARQERLTVFRQTVVKQVDADLHSGVICSITAIQRTPARPLASDGYDVLPSRDLVDWYDPRPSKRFKKQVFRFAVKPQANGQTVFIDATEWGEVLALADAPYLQGVEPTDGALEGNDRCGQSTVFGFVEVIHADKVNEPPIKSNADRFGFADYADRDDAWQQVWTYRRIKASAEEPRPGDLSLQNWGYSERLGNGGNDYPFGYLFKSKQDAAAERPDWHGGVDLAVMAAAEQRALGWHEWFKNHAPHSFSPEQITLARGALGTAHGLSKLPYVRDTRRSIGLDGFVLKFADLTGPAAQQTGTKFPDRIALGAYPADVHRLTNCKYPRFIAAAHDTLPFYIPLRAFTNRRYGNLLVAGKTMAQTFLANSATRLHPIEWSTGTAAGVAAAQMAKKGWTTRQLFEHASELQPLVAKRTPIDWTIANAPPASK